MLTYILPIKNVPKDRPLAVAMNSTVNESFVLLFPPFVHVCACLCYQHHVGQTKSIIDQLTWIAAGVSWGSDNLLKHDPILLSFFMSLGCMKTHAKPPGVVQRGGILGMELTPNTIHGATCQVFSLFETVWLIFRAGTCMSITEIIPYLDCFTRDSKTGLVPQNSHILMTSHDKYLQIEPLLVDLHRNKLVCRPWMALNHGLMLEVSHASFFNTVYIKTFHPPENETHAILQNIDMFPPSTIS